MSSVLTVAVATVVIAAIVAMATLTVATTPTVSIAAAITFAFPFTVKFPIASPLPFSYDSVHGGLVPLRGRNDALDGPFELGNDLGAHVSGSNVLCKSLLPLARVFAGRVAEHEPSLLLRLVTLQHGLLQHVCLLLDILDRSFKVVQGAIVEPAACGHMFSSSGMERRQEGVESFQGHLFCKSQSSKGQFNLFIKWI